MNALICRITALASVASLSLVLGACGGTLLEGKKVDYKSAGKVPSLEVPPDLSVPGRDDRYVVPEVGTGKGSATFSSYANERPGPRAEAGGTSTVLPQSTTVRIERSGSQRWLVVNQSPDRVWPLVKSFWQESGFTLKSENPQTGVMETDWAENRAKIPQDGIRNVLGKVLDGLYSTGERDLFRTRLERGSEQGVTEIYLSHRGMEEVYADRDKIRLVWQPRLAEPELEAEMLRRLMAKLSPEDAGGKKPVAETAAAERARLVAGEGGNAGLIVDEGFDRAWRRVGLALDRIGFAVEDRDRSKGVFFVRYADPEAKEKPGFFGSLFSSEKAGSKDARPYRVVVKDEGAASRVQVLSGEGNPEKSPTVARILALLQEQLK